MLPAFAALAIWAAVLGGAGYDVVILTRGRVKPPVGPISFFSWQPASLEPADAPTGADEAESVSSSTGMDPESALHAAALRAEGP